MRGAVRETRVSNKPNGFTQAKDVRPFGGRVQWQQLEQCRLHKRHIGRHTESRQDPVECGRAMRTHRNVGGTTDRRQHLVASVLQRDVAGRESVACIGRGDANRSAYQTLCSSRQLGRLAAYRRRRETVQQGTFDRNYVLYI